MRALLKKNMMAHKATNKITSIIYALTLGCVIFLCVAVNLIVNAVQTVGSFTFPDADIYISQQPEANYYGFDGIKASDIDPILQKYADKIKDFGLVSMSYWN